MSLRKSALTGVSAIALSRGLGLCGSGGRCCRLPTSTFNMLGTPLTQPKDFFTTVNPTNWSIGAAAQIGNLIYVGQQGSEGIF